MGWYADHFFPWLIERLEGPEISALRKRCVAPVAGEIIEIGFGTGKTLPFYGRRVTRLTAVEPSRGMNRRTEVLLHSAPFPTELVPHGAEALPFKDASFDAAVCTMTLCTVDDPSAVLREVGRLLRPEGRFHFLEHVQSEDPRLKRRQQRLDPLQRWLGCGCHLTRDTETAIREAGFEIETIEKIILQDMRGFDPRLVPMILGVAVPRLAPADSRPELEAHPQR
ncbi:MAG: class I SAM-dependent methyltransferase [Myxococcota bacterium]